MRFRTKLSLILIIPLALLGLGGMVLSWSVWHDMQSEFQRELEHESMEASAKVDQVFSNIGRASEDLARRHTDLEHALTDVQSNNLADFFYSYVSEIKLLLLVTDVEGRAIYRNWDPASYGDLVSSTLRATKRSSVLSIEGKWYYWSPARVRELSGRDLAVVYVGIEIDDRFLDIVAKSEQTHYSFGSASEKILENDIGEDFWQTIRSQSIQVPDFWVEVARDSLVIEYGRKQMMFYMGLLMVLTAIIVFYLGIQLTRRDIVEPVEAIHDAVLKNSQNINLRTIHFPKNEIGDLGSALVQQRRTLNRQESVMKQMTSQILRESSLIRLLSHDLSTPLSVIDMSAKLLKDEVVDTDIGKNAVSRIMMNAQIIKSILSHVRDMKALESGKRTLELKELTLGPILDDVLHMFQERIEAKGIRIHCDQDSRNLSLVADEISLKVSVLSNIISNAIKFSVRGARIDIVGRIAQDYACLSVRDYGAGMSEEVRQNIFTTDVPTHRVGTDGESGTGFGMPLVKFYMELYGGSIEVESKTVEISKTDFGTTISLIFKASLNQVQPKDEAA